MQTVLFEDEFFAADEVMITKTPIEIDGKSRNVQKSIDVVTTVFMALAVLGTFPNMIRISPPAYALPRIADYVNSVQKSDTQRSELTTMDTLYYRISELYELTALDPQNTRTACELESTRARLRVVEQNITDRMENQLQARLSSVDELINKAEQLVQKYEGIKS